MQGWWSVALGVLVVSFGGPEGPEEVIPFLERVTSGRGVPAARLEQVAQQYLERSGVSPINGQARALVAALEPLVPVPVLLGNRFAPPFIADALRRAQGRGLRHLLAVTTSAYPGGSSCRAYLDAIAAARQEVGDDAPTVEKLPPYSRRAGFLAPFADGVSAALATLGPGAVVAFTAHSVPVDQPGAGDYLAGLEEAAARVARLAAPGRRWDLVFQSRSGRPDQPWLGPDIADHLATLAAERVSEVVVCPIGFTSDHQEVVYDLDTKAARAAAALGITMVRTATPGTDPRFVGMLAADLNARIDGSSPARPCSASCCRAT